MSDRRRLRFGCKVVSGFAAFSRYRYPTRAQLPDAPDDWPGTLCPGSLNAAIRPAGWPAELAPAGADGSLGYLETGGFRPALAIPRDLIANNPLAADPARPSRGDALAWRARLDVPDSQAALDCWAVRQIGSMYGYTLELVSEEARLLREALDSALGVLVDLRAELGEDDEYQAVRVRIRQYLARQLQREGRWIAEAFVGPRR